MGVAGLFLVVLLAVAKVVVAAIVTNRLTKLSMPPTLLRDLSQVNIEIFLPCFIFSNIAAGITSDLLVHNWQLLLLSCCFMLNGLLAGQTISRLFSSAGDLSVVSCIFSNPIGLLVPLLSGIVPGLPNADDDALSRSLSYLFLANVPSSAAMWSTALRMLLPPEAALPPALTASTPHAKSDAIIAPVAEGDCEGEGEGEGGLDEPSNGHSQASSPRPRRALFAKRGYEATDLADAAQPPSRRAAMCNAACRAHRVCARVLRRPTAASLLGLLVGATPLRALLVAEGAPLRCLLDALLLVGKAAVPLLLFTLGGTLARGPTGTFGVVDEELSPRRRRSDGSEGFGGMSNLAMGVTVGTKLLLVPACNVATLLLVRAAGLLPVGTDPLMLLTVMLFGCSPTAMSMSTICAVAGRGLREMSVLLFWQYALVPLTMTLFATLGLVLFVER